MSKAVNSRISRSLLRAIKLAGGQSKVARLYNPPIRPQSIQTWLRQGRCPPARVKALAKATGGEVTRHDLAPGIYEKGE